MTIDNNNYYVSVLGIEIGMFLIGCEEGILTALIPHFIQLLPQLKPEQGQARPCPWSGRCYMQLGSVGIAVNTPTLGWSVGPWPTARGLPLTGGPQIPVGPVCPSKTLLCEDLCSNFSHLCSKFSHFSQVFQMHLVLEWRPCP